MTHRASALLLLLWALVVALPSTTLAQHTVPAVAENIAASYSNSSGSSFVVQRFSSFPNYVPFGAGKSRISNFELELLNNGTAPLYIGVGDPTSVQPPSGYSWWRVLAVNSTGSEIPLFPSYAESLSSTHTWLYPGQVGRIYGALRVAEKSACIYKDTWTCPFNTGSILNLRFRFQFLFTRLDTRSFPEGPSLRPTTTVMFEINSTQKEVRLVEVNDVAGLRSSDLPPFAPVWPIFGALPLAIGLPPPSTPPLCPGGTAYFPNCPLYAEQPPAEDPPPSCGFPRPTPDCVLP